MLADVRVGRFLVGPLNCYPNSFLLTRRRRLSAACLLGDTTPPLLSHLEVAPPPVPMFQFASASRSSIHSLPRLLAMDYPKSSCSGPSPLPSLSISLLQIQWSAGEFGTFVARMHEVHCFLDAPPRSLALFLFLQSPDQEAQGKAWEGGPGAD